MTFRFPAATLPVVAPSHLRHARKGLLRTSGDTPTAVHTSDRERVRHRLAAGTDPDSWSRRELIAVSLELEDPELGARALKVLIRNAARLQLMVLAQAVAYAPSDLRILTAAADRAAAGPLRGPAWFRALPPHAFGSADLLVRTIRRLEPNRQSMPDFLERLGLSAASPLGRSVAARWLADQTTRELVAFLDPNLTWSLGLARDLEVARSLFDALLLDQVARAREMDSLLRNPVVQQMLLGLEQAYEGWPTNALRRARWARHDDRVQALAHRFRIGRALDGFFEELHGDPARLRYWRRWIPHISDAQAFKRVDAFLIVIGGYAIVEFGRIGNAAYIYDAATWPSIAKKDPRTVDELKRLNRATNRIIHSGRWQAAADATLIQLTDLLPGA